MKSSTYTLESLRKLGRDHARQQKAVFISCWLEVSNDKARLGVRMRERGSQTELRDAHIRL